jgi:hypothetical protein
MAEDTYADYRLCVTIKTIMPSVIILNVVVMSVVAPCPIVRRRRVLNRISQGILIEGKDSVQLTS